MIFLNGGIVMKKQAAYLILSVCIIDVRATAQKNPILIHHKRITSQTGTRVKLHGFTPRPIDVTYIPQQVVTVKNNPTRLPLTYHTYTNGIQHLKCVLSDKSPQKKTDRKTLELLVRKEPTKKAVAHIKNNEELLKGHQAVVRLYHKVSTGEDPSKSQWKPILTLPETADTHKLLENLHISPDGNIQLLNC
jgi:hypothetical protein